MKALQVFCESCTSICESCISVCETSTCVCESCTSVCESCTNVCESCTSVCEEIKEIFMGNESGPLDTQNNKTSKQNYVMMMLDYVVLEKHCNIYLFHCCHIRGHHCPQISSSVSVY